MILSLDAAAINMFVALGCGALIGSERQVRQRMAGLRTNALVALGAAAFVTFSTLYPNEVSPTRVAAQVVSGIGFLGAGIIFRDGFNVHGLNTAATLWCSAAVGLMAGGGFWPFALVLTACVVFVNLGLRPLVKWLKKKTNAGVPISRHYSVCVICASAQEAEVRGLILRTLGLGGLHIAQIELGGGEGGDTISLTATVTAEGLADPILEQAASRLAAEPGLKRVAWQVLDET
ncbi:MgtC/SapB family protein [Gemmobacter fulvus]|uniref:MgtC/SapB family protein n=1 Tax=Gemmobacter fulvus TaxID=2840474 RepID=UPI002796BC9E|nr:MgtC/SapB family protein [Gemmobacter fulvus]MDQ1847967.1 MgtC/SapB family protein [Gemmobacter fulvus]